jgi:hypothetical protein
MIPMVFGTPSRSEQRRYTKPPCAEVLREHDCAPALEAHLAIEVKSPSVTHTVVARKIEELLAEHPAFAKDIF